jgi:hypothetical protein
MGKRGQERQDTHWTKVKAQNSLAFRRAFFVVLLCFAFPSLSFLSFLVAICKAVRGAHAHSQSVNNRGPWYNSSPQTSLFRRRADRPSAQRSFERRPPACIKCWGGGGCFRPFTYDCMCMRSRVLLLFSWVLPRLFLLEIPKTSRRLCFRERERHHRCPLPNIANSFLNCTHAHVTHKPDNWLHNCNYTLGRVTCPHHQMARSRRSDDGGDSRRGRRRGPAVRPLWDGGLGRWALAWVLLLLLLVQGQRGEEGGLLWV